MPRQLSTQQLERQRKRAKARRAIQLRVLAVVAVVAVLWAGWMALSRLTALQIDTVEVKGASRLGVEQIVERAALDEGATLLHYDRDAVEQRLLEDPWIESVDFSVRPFSTLVITVTEREPVAVVDTGLTFWFVDDESRVLAESVPDSATVLPVVRDVPDFVAEPGVVSDSETLRNVLAVLRGLSDEIVGTVRTVSAPSANETSLVTATSVEIMIGEATDLDKKSLLITDILAAEGAGVVFIDVRSVERPISRGLGE